MAIAVLDPSPLSALGTIAMMQNHSVNNRDQDVRTVKTRLMISAVLMVVLAVALLGRFVVLQVTHHERYRTMSLDNQIDLRALPPVRGMIIDRYGAVLAENHSVYELEVIPENVKDIDSMLSQIGMLVELTDQEIRRFRKPVSYTHLTLPTIYSV